MFYKLDNFIKRVRNLNHLYWLILQLYKVHLYSFPRFSTEMSKFTRLILATAQLNASTTTILDLCKRLCYRYMFTHFALISQSSSMNKLLHTGIQPNFRVWREVQNLGGIHLSKKTTRTEIKIQKEVLVIWKELNSVNIQWILTTYRLFISVDLDI